MASAQFATVITHNNGHTHVVEHVLNGVVCGRYTTQDLTAIRKGSGWEAKISEVLAGADSYSKFPSRFPWEEHRFVSHDSIPDGPLAQCELCGCVRADPTCQHVFRTEPSQEDLVEWLSKMDKEELFGSEEFSVPAFDC